MNYINYRPQLRFFLLLAHCLILVVADGSQRQQVADKQTVHKTPNDYALPTTVSRVKQLVQHFEMTEKSAKDAKFAQTTSVVLSLSQSASKFYTLAHGLPMETKCNRYVRLISLPNIRSVATISALMEENTPLNELVQADANLIARLSSERDFDSLARIQTIIQTLESEKSLGRSSFEPVVERELLQCVNYYVYRHQDAVSNVIGYVRDSLADLTKNIVDKSESKVFVEKFREPIERIISIERDEKESAQFNYDDWIQSLSQIQTLASQNDFAIPQLANDFLANKQRAERVYMWLGTHELKNRILDIESKQSWFSKMPEEKLYKATLQKLHNICFGPDVEIKPPHENCGILQDPRRAKIVKELITAQERGVDKKKALAASGLRTRGSRPAVATKSSPRVVTKRKDAALEISEKPCLSCNTAPPPESWLDRIFDGAWSGSAEKKPSKLPHKAQKLDSLSSEGLSALLKET